MRCVPILTTRRSPARRFAVPTREHGFATARTAGKTVPPDAAWSARPRDLRDHTSGGLDSPLAARPAPERRRRSRTPRPHRHSRGFGFRATHHCPSVPRAVYATPSADTDFERTGSEPVAQPLALCRIQTLVDQQLEGCPTAQPGVKIEMHHLRGAAQPAVEMSREDLADPRRPVAAVEQALRIVVLSGGQGLLQRRHAVADERSQELRSERFPPGRCVLRIQEAVELGIHSRAAAERARPPAAGS